MRLFLTTIFLLSIFAQVPSEFSWEDHDNINYLPTARNQHFPEVCNSAWAISATNVLSSRIKIHRKAAYPDVQISPQVLLECDSLNFGCYSGDPRNAFKWISKNNITDETCNPYRANSSRECSAVSKCQFCSSSGCNAQSNSKVYGIEKFGNIAGVTEMMNEIYFNGPISCGIALTPQFKNYTKGIFKDNTKSQKIQHFVTLYGWGEQNGTKFWKVLNSWGTFWGENGAARILRGQNNLAIETQCAFAVPIDTWTHDARNITPTLKASSELPSYLANINYLVPHRNSHAPTGCSSSWALAVTTTLSDKIKRDSQGKKDIILSPQVLINCKVGSCSDGHPQDAIQFIHKFGLTQQSCQNYFGDDSSRNSCTQSQNCATCTGYVGLSTCNAVKSPKRWRIPDFGSLSGAAKMKEQIDTWGPIVCGVHVTSSFFGYKGGIFKQITIMPKINHYVQVIGHGSEGGQEYWIVRNFWGSAWGEQGFFRIAMHGNNLGIETSCHYMGTPR